MPELPEVQTTVNGINKHVKGLSITDAWTDYNSPFNIGKGNIKDPTYFKYFKKNVVGTKIEKAHRRGKNILIELSNGNTILIHMKMTGHVMYGKYKKTNNVWLATEPGPLRDDPFNRFLHFALVLSNGQVMVLADMRKFAKVTMIEKGKMNESSHLSTHGPEPLEKDFGVKELRDAVMQKPNGPVKIVLMNHEVVSGIGNIYSDEILWRSSIHPLEKVKNVPEKSWPIIWKAMKETLNSGIDFGGDSMSDYRNILGERGEFQNKHNAYRKTGKKCSKSGCKGKIIKLKIGGRSAHFCDTHQKLHKKI